MIAGQGVPRGLTGLVPADRACRRASIALDTGRHGAGLCNDRVCLPPADLPVVIKLQVKLTPVISEFRRGSGCRTIYVGNLPLRGRSEDHASPELFSSLRRRGQGHA